MNTKVAALFPGQGSQYVGMAKVLRDEFSWTKEIFEEASDAVKVDLLKLCIDGPADDLQMTSNQQPTILTTSYAWFQVLKRNFDFRPAAGAGHSLGEYSALAAAGAMTLGEAARLVRKRGELMQSAVPPEKGKMAALIGLADDKVIELCGKASDGETSVVTPANFNAPGQVVISGHAGAVDRAVAIAGQPGELKARKAVPLKVSAPFHCPLMKKVAEDFVPYLQAVNWRKPQFPIVHNLDAKLRHDGDLVPLLRDQIDHPVLWTACAARLRAEEIQHFVEMGPGRVLCGLVKRIVEDGQIFALDTLDDLKALEEKFKGDFK